MKTLTAIALAGALAATTLGAASLPAQAEPVPDTTAPEFIVKFSGSSVQSTENTLSSMKRATGVDVQQVRTLGTGARLLRARAGMTNTQVTSYLKALEQRDDIEYASINGRVQPFEIPNDPKYGDLWGLHGALGSTHVWRAWPLSTGHNTTVAVIDTGITDHPELNSHLLPGYDMVADADRARDGDGRDSNPRDEGTWNDDGECGGSLQHDSSWHGTHVAGTIAATADNGVGVAGVAPQARILPIRVLAKCGGADADVIDAIVWASGNSVPGTPANQNVADVINMSLGGEHECTGGYVDAINRARAAGTTVVVAAGNSKDDASKYSPGNCPGVIDVAAGNKHGGLTSYSNAGAPVDITAPGGESDPLHPGGDILSTDNTGTTSPASPTYKTKAGTSMAAPHVAGIAALVRAAKPSASPDEIEQIIKDSARPMVSDCRVANGCGAGLADAAAAVAMARGVNADPGTNQLSNGGFESGSSGWSADPASVIGSGDTHSGSRKAQLVGVGSTSQHTLTRSIQVPNGPGMAILKYWVKVSSEELTETVARDTMEVSINGVVHHKYSNLDDSDAYAPAWLDLSAHKGSTVTLKFDGKQDSWKATAFKIDDVEVKLASFGGGPTPTPTPTPTATSTPVPGGELEPGVPVTVDVDKGAEKRFTVQLPSYARNLKVRIAQGSGDADLYLRADQPPTTSDFDCRPYKSGNNEECLVEDPKSSTYHVMVRGYSEARGVSLVATYNDGSGPGDPSKLANGRAVAINQTAEGEWRQYTVDVPSGTSQLKVNLSGGSGDADLYLRKDGEPTTSAYDCRPYKTGNAEECVVQNPSGTYYVGIRAYKAFDGASVVANWS